MCQSLLSARKSESWGSKVNDGVAKEGKDRKEKVSAGYLTSPSLNASNVKWQIRKFTELWDFTSESTKGGDYYYNYQLKRFLIH